MTEQPDPAWINKSCEFIKCFHRLNCIETGHTCAAVHNLNEEYIKNRVIK